MCKKYLLYILFFTLTITAKQTFAQAAPMGNAKNIKVSQLTDEQITVIWKRLEDSGMGEQEAYKFAEKTYGFSPQDIEDFKNRVTLLGLSKKTGVKTRSSSEKERIDFSRDINDTIIKPKQINKPVANTPAQLQVYGTNIFNQDIKFEPNFNIATPKGYILGPGDDIIVLVTGQSESTQRSKISSEGYLHLDHAEPIYLNGFTIDQATTLIKNKLIKPYPSLRSGQSHLTVNLGNARTISIIVQGEAKTPGTYHLSSLSTVATVLYSSGGPNANGSLRNIRLIRNNKPYKTIDFYSFLQNGIQEGNIRLEDQDVIQIPVYTKRVSISGEVKTPAIYELKENEHLDDLIRYAGGFTDIAYTGTAKIDQINALEREIKTVQANIFSNYTPHNGDKIEIGAITSRYTNRIVLEGSVYRPDVYELTAGLTLSQLLKTAQGLKPEAYMERGYIKRTLSDLKKDILSFNPKDIINGKTDIPLLREDTVVIMDQSVFTSDQTVTVSGFVRHPLIITYRNGLTLADVIAMAGGFDDEAADHHIEVNRVIKNESDSVANQQIKSFVVDMDNKAAAQDIKLEPMDYINVPRLVNYRSLGNVTVRGEVAFPANYPVQKRDETALDFLQRAGGVTPYGSLENTQVYRNGVRVNLDLTEKHNDIAANKNMILLPGDSVYVPLNVSYVQVSGAVNNPQFIGYNGRGFKYYINAAAGTTEKARLKGAYINYPNGLNQPVRHFLFFRTYPAVKPGSKIVVPEKNPDSKFRINMGDVGGIATALTAIVSIIAILHK